MFHMLQKSSSWLVLKQFLENPTKKHQIREISRKINLATTSVKKHIEKLIQQNLIFEKKDIFKYYQANFDKEEFRFYKKINSMIMIRDSGLLEYLENQTSAEVIILFGSCAKGEDTQESDLDLYVQAPSKNLNLKKFEKKINKKIQLFFYEDINQVPKELRNNILNGIKLAGYLKVF